MTVTCPVCRVPLAARTAQGQPHWTCLKCGGRAYGYRALCALMDSKLVVELSQAAKTAPSSKAKRCPRCSRALAVVRVLVRLEVDACNSCYFAWLDPGETEIAAGTQRKPPGPPLVQAEIDTTTADLAAVIFTGLSLVPDQKVRIRETFPMFVLALVLIFALVWIRSRGDLDAAIAAYGFVPSAPLRTLPWVTSFFIHGSTGHLLWNSYFLYLFGSDVESLLKDFRFIALVLLSDAGGNLLSVVLRSGSDIPSVGASAGIMGVMAFYARKFPRARVMVMGPLLTATAFGRPFLSWGIVPWFVIYFFSELMMGFRQSPGTGGVDSLSHAGGAVVGWLLASRWLTPDEAAARTATIRGNVAA